MVANDQPVTIGGFGDASVNVSVVWGEMPAGRSQISVIVCFSPAHPTHPARALIPWPQGPEPIVGHRVPSHRGHAGVKKCFSGHGCRGQKYVPKRMRLGGECAGSVVQHTAATEPEKRRASWQRTAPMLAQVSTVLQGHCTAISMRLCYTIVTPECNVTKKGLTPNRRKSFHINECEREDSNLHGLCPLDPKSSASANSATLACVRKSFHQCNICHLVSSSGGLRGSPTLQKHSTEISRLSVVERRVREGFQQTAGVWRPC